MGHKPQNRDASQHGGHAKVNGGWHKSENGSTTKRHKEKFTGKHDGNSWREQGEWSEERNTQQWTHSPWIASEKPEAQKKQDCRLPLPPVDPSKFDKVVTAEEVK